MLGGEKNGELWEWHAASGWQKVPGSEAAGANGLELSDDGKTLYVAAWGSQSFFRLSQGQTPAERQEISLGFRVDNLHRARDGSLLRAGQGQGRSDDRQDRPKDDCRDEGAAAARRRVVSWRHRGRRGRRQAVGGVVRRGRIALWRLEELIERVD
jgi:hypothetical protein